MNRCIVRGHGGSLRYRTGVRLQCNVPLLAGKGRCGLRGIVDGGRCCSCGGGSSSGCRSTGSTRRNGHRRTGRRWRRRSEAILQRYTGSDRKPVHWFGLYSSHDWFSLKFLNIFPQIPERSLCIIVRFERNVPGIVVSKFARDEAWTVFTLEYVLDFLDRRVVRYLAQDNDATLVVRSHLEALFVHLHVGRFAQHVRDELDVLGELLHQVEVGHRPDRHVLIVVHLGYQICVVG